MCPRVSLSACHLLFLLLTFLFQHPPSPTYHARVVAAAVGGGGVVVLMIANVGLVQVTYCDDCMNDFVDCVSYDVNHLIGVYDVIV